MVAGLPQACDLQAWREELDAVLQSEGFRHAPRLARLLSHLCEKRFAGQAGQIKEYSIGVDVFGRGVGFNQETDSIVRVEVNRLRRRLADYYAAEGASHRLRITIPVGQYVPEFQPADRPAPPSPPARPASLRRWTLPLAALSLLIALATLLLLSRRPAPPAPSPASAPPQEGSGQLVGLPPGDEVRILAGSSRSYVDHAGKLWSADAFFTGGAPFRGSSGHIRRTLDPSFYRACRQGQFRYDIPLKKGVYELRLHFAEIVFGPENNGPGGEGSRLLDVRANGRPLLTRFDIAADAGGDRIADVRVFPGILPAADGKLHLEFSAETSAGASLAAIEILPGIRGHMRPLRLLARPTPYYDNDSRWWSPDNYFDGGQLATWSEPVQGTDDPELYETERWGNFSYAIPASPGKYRVALHFAVRHARRSVAGAPDSGHVFDVFCNGRAILERFDLEREARDSGVVIRRASGLEPNAQGKLLLSFVPVKGYATVTGIEVLP